LSFGLWCLTIFQLYHGSQFYWWMKPEYPEKTNEMTFVHWNKNNNWHSLFDFSKIHNTMYKYSFLIPLNHTLLLLKHVCIIFTNRLYMTRHSQYIYIYSRNFPTLLPQKLVVLHLIYSSIPQKHRLISQVHMLHS
jgi:hypothetical protein